MDRKDGPLLDHTGDAGAHLAEQRFDPARAVMIGDVTMTSTAPARRPAAIGVAWVTAKRTNSRLPTPSAQSPEDFPLGSACWLSGLIASISSASQSLVGVEVRGVQKSASPAGFIGAVARRRQRPTRARTSAVTVESRDAAPQNLLVTARARLRLGGGRKEFRAASGHTCRCRARQHRARRRRRKRAGSPAGGAQRQGRGDGTAGTVGRRAAQVGAVEVRRLQGTGSRLGSTGRRGRRLRPAGGRADGT